MPQSCRTDRVFSSNCTGIFLLLIFIATIYSNTLNADWHLDDYPNIIENKYIQWTELSPSTLSRSFQPYQNNLHLRLSRPISFFTLSLNWFIGNQHVIGYHIANISIHIASSVFLFLFLLLLFKTPRLNGLHEGDEYNIALLATVLWAIHPIQTQAVTYIVQRMASLSAMFYIAAMFCYIQGRLKSGIRSRLSYYSGSLICMLLALGSKENAITFPLAIGLVEIIFFQNFSSGENRKKCVQIAIASTVATLAILLLLLFAMIPDPATAFKARSGQRSFSMTQRLLTEPRIVMNYLIQIFYPLLNRFSIEHPIAISVSLVNPITTLFSLLSIIALLIFGFSTIHRFPSLSLSILFYFLNQVVESTFLPLELVFEHRNYLPSMFLFLPVSIGVIRGLHYFRKEKKQAMFFLCSSFLAFLLIVMGMTTFIRNGVWGSEKTLWEDALKKAPQSARPWGSLAFYYSRTGNYDKALEMYEASLTKQRTSAFFPAVILRNMGFIYSLKHDYDRALACYDRAIAEDPDNIQVLYEKASILIMHGDWDAAKTTVHSLISKGNSTKDAYYLMGVITLHSDAPEEALKLFRMANQISPGEPKTYIQIGVSMSMMGHYQKADWFLNQARRLTHNDMIPLFYQIDNYIKSGNKESLNQKVDLLVRQFHINDIDEVLFRLSHDNMWAPVSSDAIGKVIRNKLDMYSDKFLHCE